MIERQTFVSRYIDLFIQSEQPHEPFAAQLTRILRRRLQRVTDRGAQVLYLCSERYKWFDVCQGMLDRHPEYGYQLYVGRGHHDVGDRLRVNFAWSILEKLAAHYPIIFEDSLSGVSIHAAPGIMLDADALAAMTRASAGDVATIFAASPESPSTFTRSLEKLLHMEAHSSTRNHSPVMSVMVGEAVRLRVEMHDYEDVAGLSLAGYRYCIDLDPLDAPQVFETLKAARRYRLLWLENLAHVVAASEAQQ